MYRELRRQFALKPGDDGYASLEARHYASQRPAIIRHLNECILIAQRGHILPNLHCANCDGRWGPEAEIQTETLPLSGVVWPRQSTLSRAGRSADELVAFKSQLKQIGDTRGRFRRFVRTRASEI